MGKGGCAPFATHDGYIAGMGSHVVELSARIDAVVFPVGSFSLKNSNGRSISDLVARSQAKTECCIDDNTTLI